MGLLAATFAAYSPALHGEFLLDDELHVTRPELRGLAGLARIWFEVGATQQYYPVLHSAFWLEHRLWGEAVLGYHVINVLLHASAAFLVVALMRRLLLPGAWLAAYIFALHPVCVESVAWIAEQKNTLSAVFYLAAAFVYVRFDEERRWPAYLLASVLFGLALLSKTATATLPAALLVILWWQRGAPAVQSWVARSSAFRPNPIAEPSEGEVTKLPVAVDVRRHLDRCPQYEVPSPRPLRDAAEHSGLGWKRDVLPLLPWFGAALLAGLITLRVERGLISGIGADLSLTGLERTLVAGRALWFYLLKLLWPANLSFFYERWPVSASAAWQYIFPLAAIGVAAGLAWGARRSRAPLAAFLFFCGTLFPVLGFFGVEWFVFSFVADHFIYLASLGIIVPVAVVIARSDGKRMSRVAATVLLAIVGLLTWRHSGTFRDNITLYTHAVARSPGSAVAHNHLGVALAKSPGREVDAIAEFEAALRINPAAAEVHENLGDLLLRIPERSAKGVAHFEKALQLKPSLTRVHRKLGVAFSSIPGRMRDAIAHYREALRHEAEVTPARTRLQHALAEAHYNLGNALLRSPAELAGAIAHYEEAVRHNPGFVEARTNLGTALAGVPGRLHDAIAQFEAALRVNPDFPAARTNLEHARRLLEKAGGKPD